MKIRFNTFILLGVIGVMTVFIPLITRSNSKIESLEKEKQALLLKEKKIDNQMKVLEVKLEEVEDYYYIEKFAREELGMNKQGEIIYKVVN